MPPSSPSESSLTGQVLIAMPALDDPEFSHSVVYLCAHGEEGAMGLITPALTQLHADHSPIEHHRG